ncbi:MAG: signal peptidase II [Victivallales bacterium]|nr:signal peptidase II [Victivallales bacterium]
MPSRFSKTSLLGWPGVIALTVVAMDHLTKYLVYANWPDPAAGNEIVIIPGVFSLVHVRNLGAAWGIFHQYTWLLAVISLLAALVLIVFFKPLSEGKPPLALAYGTLLGGILGNFIDRAFFSEGVVDFLDFHLGRAWSWPAFNVADGAITCSVIFLLVYAVFFERHEKSVK